MSRYLPKTTRLRRLESILSGVEQGIPQDFKRLCDAWPSDIVSAKRAMTEVLKHLGSDRIPDLNTPSSESALKLLLGTEAFHVFSGALDRTDKMGDAHVQEIYQVIQENIRGIAGWLTFLVENSALISPGQTVDLGIQIAANTLRRLMDKDRVEYLQGNTEAVEQLVDVMLAIWLDSVPDDYSYDGGDDLRLTSDNYEKYVYSIFKTFWCCIKTTTTRVIAVQKIAAYDRNELGHLVHVFTYRCEQWAATYKHDKKAVTIASDLVATVIICQLITMEVPVFSRAVAKSVFVPVVMASAMEFPLASKPNVPSIPTQVARLLLYPQPSNAYEILHIVPELLDCGLIELIAHQLLSSNDDPFHEWYGRKPLVWLYNLCYLPRISYALRWAIEELPDKTLGRLKTNATWRKFHRAVLLFENAYDPDPLGSDLEGEEDEEDYTEPILLCDNVQHFAMGQEPMDEHFEDSFQCSWCRVRTYCSAKCQRHDWKVRHKHECADDRVYRIDRQLQGAWISHRSRMLLLRVSQILLDGSIPTMKADEEESPDGGKHVALADLSTYPLSLLLPKLETLLSICHGSHRLFQDERSRALIEEYQTGDGNQRLVASIAPFGEYFIVTLGRFLEEPRDSSDEETFGDESSFDSDGSNGSEESEVSDEGDRESDVGVGSKRPTNGHSDFDATQESKTLNDTKKDKGSSNLEYEESFTPDESESTAGDLTLLNGFVQVWKVDAANGCLYEIDMPQTGITSLSTDWTADHVECHMGTDLKQR